MKRFGDIFNGIYGFDGLSCGLLLFSVIINLIAGLSDWFAILQSVSGPLSVIACLLLLLCIFRVFSKNYEKRERENRRFMAVLRPLCDRMIARQKEKEDAKLFRFFKCPVCRQKLRVPKGKGKVEITCPKCGNKFIKKA